MDNRSHEELHENYKKIAEEAIKYARGKAKKSATLSFLSRVEQTNISHQVVQMRQQYSKPLDFKNVLQEYFDISSSSIKFIRRVKKSIKKIRVGNCGELSDLAMYYCRKHNCPAEVVNLPTADHAFIVINRLPESDINDPSTWGEFAIICDPLTEQTYSPQLIKQYMTGYRYDSSREYPNIDIPYDEIKINESGERFRKNEETKKEDINHAKSQHTLIQTKLDHFATIFKFINISEEHKNKILEEIKKFESQYKTDVLKTKFDNKLEQESGHFLERKFHKLNKKIINLLYSAYETEIAAEDDIARAIIYVTKINKDPRFINYLILNVDNDPYSRILDNNLSKQELAKLLNQRDSLNNSLFMHLFKRAHVDTKKINYIWHTIDPKSFVDLLLFENHNEVTVLDMMITKGATEWLEEIGKFLIKNKNINDNDKKRIESFLLNKMKTESIDNVDVFYQLIKIFISLKTSSLFISNLLTQNSSNSRNVLQIFLIKHDQNKVKELMINLPLSILIAQFRNHDINKHTALHTAASGNNEFFIMLRFRLMNEANLEDKELYLSHIKSILILSPISPLALAIDSGNTEIAKSILELMHMTTIGATINDYASTTLFPTHNQTPLRLAIDRQDVDMVKLLLEYGANPLRKYNDHDSNDSDEAYINELAAKFLDNNKYQEIKNLIKIKGEAIQNNNYSGHSNRLFSQDIEKPPLLFEEDKNRKEISKRNSHSSDNDEENNNKKIKKNPD